ncbi:hypothetical protein D3C84_975590 [compost metagenome]
MAILGQARLRDVQFRCGVLVDRPKQFKAALRPLRITLLTVGAVTFQAIGRIDDQCLAIAGLCLELGCLQLFLVGADFQYPLLFFIGQGLGTA